MNVQKIEELALNAWPGLQTYLYDGWVIRLAEGYTKRANSVTPLYEGCGDFGLEEKVERCEEVYQGLKRPQPTIFRIPSFVEGAQELDAFLAERGYERLDETLVLGMDLEDAEFEQSERAYIMPGRDGLNSWLSAYGRLSKSQIGAVHEKILGQILGQRCPMEIMVNGEVVACGLGVYDDGYMGFFDIVTAEAHRRQGYGRELMESLLGWGVMKGALYAYIQVVAENRPAVNLYKQLGFEEQNHYWYRMLK